MVSDGGPVEDGHILEIALDAGYLSVSNFSSLLRVLQAALRVAAQGVDPASDPFSVPPYPVLRMFATREDDGLVLRLAFFDPLDSSTLHDLCERTFAFFLDRLSEFIKRLPQRGLWGGSVAGAQVRIGDSEVTKRLDQVRVELRRLGRTRVRFAGRTVTFDGDRVELG